MFLEHKTEGEAVVQGWRRVMARAADIVEERGLVRLKYGGTTEDHDPVCATRAFDIASFELGLEIKEADEAVRQMRRHLHGSICGWVDSGRASQSEVVAIMRKLSL